jgi:hypothetical protein
MNTDRNIRQGLTIATGPRLGCRASRKHINRRSASNFNACDQTSHCRRQGRLSRPKLAHLRCSPSRSFRLCLASSIHRFRAEAAIRGTGRRAGGGAQRQQGRSDLKKLNIRNRRIWQEIERTGWGSRLVPAMVLVEDNAEVSHHGQFTSILDEFRQIWPYILRATSPAICAGSMFMSSGSFSVAIGTKIGRRSSQQPNLAEIGRSLVTVCIFASVGTALRVGAMHGLFSIYTDVSLHGWPYLVGSVGRDDRRARHLFLLGASAHASRSAALEVLPRHRSHNPTPWTAYAFDPGKP